MVSAYNDVFKGLDCIKSKATIRTENHISPVIDPLRRMPHAIQNAVIDELDHVLKIHVIVEQIEPKPWVNSFGIVQKPGKL